MTLLYPVRVSRRIRRGCRPLIASTVKRSPQKPLIVMRHTLSELTGPVYGHETVREHDHDLTIQHKGEPLGERIIVHGHVLDEDGRGVPNTLVEIWQANACGRYIHVVDQHPAPLDPNFTGAGRAQTDAKGYYKFVTIKPGAYPWGNHPNAWRPAHIHFSVFGHSFVSRLVTQMYFPGDPLFPFDPIFNSVTDEKARDADGLVVRSGKHQAGMGACATASTSCCAGATPRRWRPNSARQCQRNHAIADRRSLFQIRADAGRRLSRGTTPSPTIWSRLMCPASASASRSGVRRRRRNGAGCMLEIWQADAQGRFADPQDSRALPNASFKGFGRCGTDAKGGYSFDTIKPGSVPGPDGKPQAPHILLAVYARGMPQQLITRIYFDG